jgi:hypothetical protein
MTNSDDQFKPARRPLPDPLPSPEEAFKLFMAAMDDVFHAYQVSTAASRLDGFNAGVEAYRKWLEEQVKKFQEEQAPAQVESAPPPSAPNDKSHEPNDQTANERVLLSIIAHPGRRGVDIANAFVGALPPLPERTVRTALFRLKNANKIMRVSGLWYAWDVGQKLAHQYPQRIRERTGIPTA